MNETTINPREQRGLEIAATHNIHRNGTGWIVPSQTGNGQYRVHTDAQNPRCTCPDFETRGCKCKHIFAVEYAVKREQRSDGSTTVTESVTVTKRTTYPQDWPAYNAAQTNEKEQFQVLLHRLCETIQDPPQTSGRPRLPLADAVFAITFKVYSTVSGRRFISDLTDAHTKGYLSCVPHFNSISNYLENPALHPLLSNLISQSALPLKTVETDFAVDSTGFGTGQSVSWYNARYGHQQNNHDWLKAHLMCGVKTNIVTSVEISGRNQHDSPVLPTLVDETAKSFTVNEVSADKGYSSVENHEAIVRHGATPFISFKSNATGAKGGVFQKMYHYFCLNREAFLTHYHKRSNVESTMSMIKAKFGGRIRSKAPVAQANELLCKILCHNLCVLIQSMHELGIAPTFCAESSVAQKVVQN